MREFTPATDSSALALVLASLAVDPSQHHPRERVLYAEILRLQAIEQRAKDATHAAVVADMNALQAVWNMARFVLTGDGRPVDVDERTFPATWAGMMAFLDEQYPAGVFPETAAADAGDDLGPRMVRLARELTRAQLEVRTYRNQSINRLLDQLAAVRAVLDAARRAEFPGTELGDRIRTALDGPVGSPETGDTAPAACGDQVIERGGGVVVTCELPKGHNRHRDGGHTWLKPEEVPDCAACREWVTDEPNAARLITYLDIALSLLGSIHDHPSIGERWIAQNHIRTVRAALSGTSGPADREERLRWLESLPEGWDSYGSAPVQPGVGDRARQVLAWFDTDPAISATADGGIDLSWADESVSVEVRPGGYTVVLGETEMVSDDARKLSCPVCDQWSAVGPDAEVTLFAHWAAAHLIGPAREPLTFDWDVIGQRARDLADACSGNLVEPTVLGGVLARLAEVAGYVPRGSVPDGSVEVPAVKRCGLCGHAMTFEMCGHAAAWTDDRETMVPLCHANDHDCYHRWTVYGVRPV